MFNLSTVSCTHARVAGLFLTAAALVLTGPVEAGNQPPGKDIEVLPDGRIVIRGAETDENFKPTSVAMERLLEDKIKYEFVEKTDVPDDLFKE